MAHALPSEMENKMNTLKKLLPSFNLIFKINQKHKAENSKYTFNKYEVCENKTKENIEYNIFVL